MLPVSAADGARRPQVLGPPQAPPYAGRTRGIPVALLSLVFPPAWPYNAFVHSGTKRLQTGGLTRGLWGQALR